MKRTHTIRIARTLLIAVAMMFVASESFAALNAYLTLKGSSNGKSYKCPLDESGKFSFSNVEPGSYSLIFTSEDGSNPPSTIHIESFSWGASNTGSMSSNSSGTGRASASRSTPVTRSNISNNRVSCPAGVSVATGDLDGDGCPDKITSPVDISISNADGARGQHFTKVLLENVMVSSACSPTGACKAGWNLKENVK